MARSYPSRRLPRKWVYRRPHDYVPRQASRIARRYIAGPVDVLARRFDDVDDYIEAPIGGANVTGDLTFAALVRSNASGEFSPIYGQRDAADTAANRSGLEIAIGNGLQIRTNNTASIAPSITVVPADGWVLVAVTKAAGSTFPRFHAWKAAGGWTHEDYAVIPRPDPTSCAGGNVEFARLGASATLGDLDLAVAGVWTSALSDGNVEALLTNRATQDWANLSPAALWDFGQASVATPVADLIGAADESAIVGTTVITNGPIISGTVWTYGIALSETPTPGGATAGGNAPTVNVATAQGGGTAGGNAPSPAQVPVAQGGATAAGNAPTATTSVAQGGGTAQGNGPSPAQVPVAPGGATAGGVAPTVGGTTTTVDVNLITETATAQAMGRAKVKTIGLSSETDTAFSITATKGHTLGIATETDTAFSFGKVKVKAIGLSTETDTALAIARTKTKAIGLTSETDTAFSIAPSKSRTLGIATETDTALPIVVDQVGAGGGSTNHNLSLLHVGQ